MLKTLLKKSKLALAFVLALSLCFASVPAAFAAGDPIEGSEASPAEAAITKVLQMPVGTPTPEVTFNFVAEPISVDGNTDVKPPALDTDYLTVKFDSQDTTEAVGDVVSIAKETQGDIFTGINFPHAGTYVYEITETSGAASTEHETWTYSQALYTLNVYVKNGDNGPYIFAIGAVQTTGDDGNKGSGDKVDPTPGGGDSYDYSQMIFTNTYVKTNGTDDPDNPDPTKPAQSTLSVSKTVAGEFGSDTLYFDYEMKINAPSLVADDDVPAYYPAYVVDSATDKIVTSGDNAASDLIAKDDSDQPYIMIATGDAGPTYFSLKHGQKLVFVNTPVGTNYDVTEAATDAYIATAVVTTNGTPGDVLGDETKAGLSVTTDTQLVGNASNSADFTNTRPDVSLTGVILANLPFYGMIALAVAALVTFVAVKSRKRKSSGAQA